MGRPSLVATAKMVRPIMSDKSLRDRVKTLWLSTSGSSGNSSASMAGILYSVAPHWIWTVRASVVTVTVSSGSCPTTSANFLAERTRDPFSWISAGTMVWIPVSRLYPVNLSSPPASRRMPSKAGIVLLGEVAREVVEMAACKRAFSQENFIGSLHSFFFSIKERRRIN